LASVASLAGVAIATASYALRGDPKISPATRKRVCRAARERGYVPNPEIGRLMHLLRQGRPVGQKSSFALLSFDDQPHAERNYYFKALVESAEQRGRELGYNIDRLTLAPHEMTPGRLTRILRSRGIQGVLIPPLRASMDCSALADWSRFSVVAATYTARGLPVNRVVPHHAQIAVLALSVLEARGFRRIGLVTEAGDHDRVSYAYWAALALHQQEGRSAPVPPIQFGDPDGFRSWREGHHPDVILATEERLATVLAGLSGRKGPHSPPIAVLNRSRSGRYEGVYPHPDIIGRIAVDLLAAQIQRGERGRARHPNITMVEGSWIAANGRMRRRPIGNAEDHHRSDRFTPTLRSAVGSPDRTRCDQGPSGVTMRTVRTP
jgi:DNA-binding LacI/PurR family transcriptional regulator